MQSPLCLAVLNPGGRDREQRFPDGAGRPDDSVVPHPPVNYHAYAACTGGSFHGSTTAVLATGRPVLLLLRRDLRAGWRTLEQLKAAGRTVAVTFKEAGAMQVAARLTHPKEVELLARIAAAADGCLAPCPWLMTFFQALGGGKPVWHIPTPYPVEDPRWDFSVPVEERRGIFVGTREWDVPSRQHLAAVLLAKQIALETGERATVINPDGRRGTKMLAALGFSADPRAALRVVPGPLPYTGYLREMAGHKIVFQLDASDVPGQVAGDALLCRVPCVGGDGAVERLAFAPLAGGRHTPDELAGFARALLTDADAYRQASQGAMVSAAERLSFRVVAGRLQEFYRHLGAAV